MQYPDPGPANVRLARFVLVALLLWTSILVPVWVIAQGFVPRDDALRHVAKALSGRSWDQVLVVREDVRIDQHPGWHTFLGTAQHLGVTKPGRLIALSVWCLAFAALVAPLGGFRRPEAWMFALLLAVVAEPALLVRLFLGRPFLVSMAALLFICARWRRLTEPMPPALLLAGMTGAVAAANWMHGNSILWLLPVAAFTGARQWLALSRLLAVVTAGVIIGSALTGHPIEFVWQTLLHTVRALGSGVASWLLVGEFQPSGGSLMFLALSGVVLQTTRNGLRDVERNPLFWLGLGGWVLGLHTQRFWLDWGLPASVVFLAQAVESWLETDAMAGHLRRLTWTAILCGAFAFATVSDRDRRWSNEQWRVYAPIYRAENRAWLPDAGGVLYNDNMNVFYLGFYLNPHLDYRFLVGFEPGLLPEQELAQLRQVQRQGSTDEAIRPWVRRLRPADRILVTRRGPAPRIPELAWFAPMEGVWIGRPLASRVGRAGI